MVGQLPFIIPVPLILMVPFRAPGLPHIPIGDAGEVGVITAVDDRTEMMLPVVAVVDVLVIVMLVEALGLAQSLSMDARKSFRFETEQDVVTQPVAVGRKREQAQAPTQDKISLDAMSTGEQHTGQVAQHAGFTLAESICHAGLLDVSAQHSRSESSPSLVRLASHRTYRQLAHCFNCILVRNLSSDQA